MQNGQTEPKLYVYTTKALFVHSKKNTKKENPSRIFIIKHLIRLVPRHLPLKGKALKKRNFNYIFSFCVRRYFYISIYLTGFVFHIFSA